MRLGETDTAQINSTNGETPSGKIADLRPLLDNSIPIPFRNRNDGRKRPTASRRSEEPAGNPN